MLSHDASSPADQLDHLQITPTSDVIEVITEQARGLSREQLLWSSGYLAGLAQNTSQRLEETAVVSAETQKTPATESTLDVFYASETGNAESLAQQFHKDALTGGLSSRLYDLRNYRARDLTASRYAVFIVSTQGEGEVPNGCEAFFNDLNGRRAPDLAILKYAVLALGDSSYPLYCKVGKEVNQRLSELGATQSVLLTECDVDFNDTAKHWQKTINDLWTDELTNSDVAEPSLDRVVQFPDRDIVTANSLSSAVTAEVLCNQKITGAGSSIDVRHIELLVDSTRIDWQPGDALAIRFENPQSAVDRFLTRSGLVGDSIVCIEGDELSLSDALSTRIEITRILPRFLRDYAKRCEFPELGQVANDSVQFSSFVKNRDLSDVLVQYPPTADFNDLLLSSSTMKAREYSIASSPEFDSEMVALTVRVVGDKERLGAASTWLSEREAEHDNVRVWVKANTRFRLPDNDVPVIMIGPGTGVAPFRAFLQSREARNAKGKNWLLFGYRQFQTDFLYQIDWLRWRKMGLLSHLDTAFSREPDGGHYVQQRLLEQSDRLLTWLDDGAEIFVCGDAKHMAVDVEETIAGILETSDGLSIESLKSSGRYKTDVY